MSRESVAVARSAVDAWNAGDMTALGEMYDRDVVMLHLEGWPEPGPSVGRDAVMRQWENQRETWDIDQIAPVSDFVEAGDRLVVRYRWRGSGHGPGHKDGVHDRDDDQERKDRRPRVVLGPR